MLRVVRRPSRCRDAAEKAPDRGSERVGSLDVGEVGGVEGEQLGPRDLLADGAGGGRRGGVVVSAGDHERGARDALQIGAQVGVAEGGAAAGVAGGGAAAQHPPEPVHGLRIGSSEPGG